MILGKRHLLRQAAALASAHLLHPGRLRAADFNRAAPVTRDALWSRDAGALRIAPGLWPNSTPLPTDVHFENVLLRMPDGIHLNALIYMPAAVRGRPVGVQLKVDPYRSEPNDWVAAQSIRAARAGFASVFVDVRGSGGSEGAPIDEYTEAEYDDTVHVIDWLSKQPWCNGNVGMYGTSYSAFNSVWTAARYKPPALKAIFVRAGTDDRYTDDVHSPGGIMMMVDTSWVLGMITDNATPGAPDYDLNSAASLARWNTPPWMDVYLRNQLDGPHYRRGSLAPDQYGLLTTPTFLAGGYLDMYQNFVPRIMKHSPAITRGIMGTWHHSMTWPGPVLDWDGLQNHWFDHFLNGVANGVLDEPRLAFYLPQWRRQHFRDAGAIPGAWHFTDAWPDTAYDPPRKLFFRPDASSGGELADMAADASSQTLDYHPGTGGSTESIGPDNYEGFFGLDSRADDVWGLAFDTPPLRDPVCILGFVKARLFVSATAPLATWIVHVNDLAPDGTSYIVTYGFLNGAHRRSHVTPENLVPDEKVALEFDLFCTGYRFLPGHRIRVVVTNAYFPVVWPSPYRMTTTLFTGGDQASHIALPTLDGMHELHGTLPVLAEHVGLGSERSGDSMSSYRLTRDFATGATSARFQMGPSVVACAVDGDDPAKAELTIVTSEQNHPLGSSRVIETHTEASLRSTTDRFHMDIACRLLENGRLVREKTWLGDFPRAFV